MRPDRLFGVLPAKRPLTSLEAIVEDWNYRFIESDAKRFRDTVVDFCAKAPSFDVAVNRACLCRNEQGKKHNHQSKVRDVTLALWNNEIIVKIDPSNIKDFDDLFDKLERTKIWGIGPVTHYDVATRIGAYLKMEPEQLYLHAGVLDGWKLLYPGWHKHLPFRIPRGCWPAELQVLPADQVEDLLCAYRTFLNPNMVRRNAETD